MLNKLGFIINELALYQICQIKREKNKYIKQVSSKDLLYSTRNSEFHLNAQFQRIAKKDKKTFLVDQCKEIEEKNRMGKTRDSFKKIRDTKGTFHAKMGSIKDRNGMGT